MMRLTLIALVLLQSESVKPRYAGDKGARDKIYSEIKIGVKIEGTEQLANFIRSMHPFLSMEKLVIRAEGGSQVVSKNKRKMDYDEARVEARYDDEDFAFDFQK